MEHLILTRSARRATGTGLANVLVGNDGSNLLDGGTGADTMTGKARDDRYIVDNMADIVVEDAAGGNDIVVASVSYSIAATDVEALLLTGTAAISGRATRWTMF